jgi:DNA-directed RNA polymerase subunit RPC12/RpoP
MILEDLACPECGAELYSYSRDPLINEVQKACWQCGAKFNINKAVQ